MTGEPMQVRIGWLDSAKGLGMILVVVGHALGGLIDSTPDAVQPGFRTLFFLIYTFHMPLFFLLSGLLVRRRLEKGAGIFVRGLLPTMVWPYFLWSGIQFTIIYAMGALVNRPATDYWPVIVSLPWKTVSQFWFLYALFGLHILSTAIVPRLGREAFVLIALGLKAIPLILPLPFALKLICNHAFFYAVGVWLAVAGIEHMVIRYRSIIKAVMLPLLAVAMGALTLGAVGEYGSDIAFATAASPEIANLAWRFAALPAAFLGVAAILGVASLSQVSGMAWLCYIGRMTMPVFLLHVLCLAGMRIILTRFDILSDQWGLLVVLVVVGLIGPLIAERIARALHLTRLVGFG
jgi:fucose 4-O-acetylase-like acetyltransferase